MPWKECLVMDERLRFVAKLLDGEAMSGLCREFGISRKTGYKIFNRYKESGFEALSDRCSATGTLCQSVAAADGGPDCQL
jgi:transposase